MSILGQRLVPFTTVLAFVAVTTASAQCLEWDPAFDFQGGVDGPTVWALATFDDGTGPALYVGGDFETAGSVQASGIARWNGSSWSAVGGGVGGTTSAVSALAVFDDGTGPALYAGGLFTSAGGTPASNIARWDGSSWTPLGAGISGAVWSLRVFDDGAGPDLYAAGLFWWAGTVTTTGIARWDGTAWTSVGGGANSSVYCLEVFDDGTGPALYAGGEFSSTGGVPTLRIARWNGTTWSALGPGLNQWVRTLGVYDDGSGAALYAGGTFTNSGGSPMNKVAKWDGLAWSSVGGGVNSAPYSMRVFDDGTGQALYVSGGFSTAGGAPASFIARWNGTVWTTLGSGTDGTPFDLLVHDDGSGPALFAGGYFTTAGGVGTPAIAKWSGAAWSPVGASPSAHGTSHPVLALAVHDDGGGPALYAGGEFTAADGLAANHVARWTGAGWAALGSGLSGGLTYAASLATYDYGTGPALYVGGEFAGAGGVAAEGIARWDGASWSALPGLGAASDVSALCVFDGELYAGGAFDGVGGCGASAIVRWDGSTWTCPPSGGTNGPIKAMAVFDEGDGPALFIAGTFTTAGGVAASHIARFDGTTWSAVGGGTDNNVLALIVFDDGSGSALYAAGGFTNAGGAPANRVARWNGSSWSSLGGGGVGGGVDGVAWSLAGFDDGSGPALCVGGDFTHAGGTPANRVARWNGSSWAALANGVNGTVRTLCAFDDGTGGGADLFAGGSFLAAGSTPSSRIARWHGCSEPGTRFCFGDGSSLACPCANQGTTARGCNNSASTGGALLYATGTTVPDTVVLRASDELPNALSIFLQGNAVITAAPFGDGLRCAGGILKRLYTKNASGGLVRAPEAGNPSITTQSANLGDPILPGERRYYQVYYRDPNLAFCPSPMGNSFNVTGAVKIVW